MKTLLAIIVMLITLLGCVASGEHRPPHDRLAATDLDLSGTGVWMTWIKAQPHGALGRAAFYVDGVGPDPLEARRPACAVWAPVPKHEHDLEGFALLGHEFVHCMHGQFHHQIPAAQREAVREIMSPVRPVVR